MKYLLTLLFSLTLSAQAQFTLEPLVTGLERIVFLTHAQDERLFIVEQAGRIRIFENNLLQPEPFLTLAI